jgi:hypothetical protein
MLYWEARRRLAEVRAFRALVHEYFSNTARDNTYRHTRHPLKDLSEVREQINKGIPAAVRNCYKVGQPVGVDYLYPREGIKAYVNVIESLWGLDRFQIPISTVFDYLDRVIGIYEEQVKILGRQRWNPFYWLRLGFLWVIGLPFRLLGAAGFNAPQIEASLGGKIAKAIIGLIVGVVAFTSALLQALYYLGFKTGWRDLWQFLHHK